MTSNYCCPPSVLIAHASLGECWSDEAYRSHVLQLPASWRRQLKNYYRSEDRQRSAIGKLLLKKALGWHQFSYETVPPIAITPYGKPYFTSGFHFNITHSFDKVVCVSSTAIDVGIDIELVRPVELSGCRDAMSFTQWQQIHVADDPILAFWRYWTAKEAIVKADGRGVGLPLYTIPVAASVNLPGRKLWHITELNIWRGYSSFIATDQIVKSNDTCFEEFHF